MFRNARARISYANVTSTAALVLALGGGAYAAVSGIPGKDGVIHGCFQKKKGNLRVVRAGKRCAKSEAALSWNQKGIQGIQGVAGTPGAAGAGGAKGDKGDKGDQGPIGPSDLFSRTVETNINLPTDNTFGRIMGYTLPAGKYLILAKIWVQNNAISEGTNWDCVLNASGVSSDEGEITVPPRGSLQGYQNGVLTLMLPVTLASPTDVALSCATPNTDQDATQFASKAKIEAIRVGNITSTDTFSPE